MVQRFGSPQQCEVVAIASSAGGINALGELLGALPSDLHAPILVVQHLDPRRHTIIAEVLGRRSTIRVKLAEANDRIVAGIVYIAPPDHHLLVTPTGVLTLTSSELVHFVRPSADLLFESVAGAYGRHAIACVLTGTGSDGAMGVGAIKSRGGKVIVQDLQSAEFKGMPQAAIRTDNVDFVLPLHEIARTIARLVKTGMS